MLQFLVKIIISAFAVMISAWLLPGVEVLNDNFWSALIIAAVLALLNAILKPLLIILTIPITLFSFGLFLLVINALIILIADKLVDDFVVHGFWWALLFSIILSVITSIFEGFNRSFDKKDK